MKRRGFLCAILLLCPVAAAAHERLPIRIETESGVIEAELEAGRAPVTVCNFLRYMRAGDFDGGRFFRTVRSGLKGPNPVPIDVIQMEAREGPEFDRFGPIALERTSQTKLTHKAGALSMARWGPDTATSSWSIVVSDSREMDFGGGRNPDGQGFAVFGFVVRGMDIVHAIHIAEADQEQLRHPINIKRILPGRNAAQAVERALKKCGMPQE